MKEMLKDLRKHVVVGIVGGSDMAKQKEQLGNDGKHTEFFSNAWSVGLGRLFLL